jgi:hypothetical protein
MTYRGHVKNGAVVLDAPAALPEGAAVEVVVVTTPMQQQRPPISSIDELRGQDVEDDAFEGFDETLREWRKEPWRLTPQEPLE